MNAFVNRLRSQWQAMPAAARLRLQILVWLGLVILLAMLSVSLGEQRGRQERALAEADVRFEGVQTAVAEIGRLRREVPAASPLVTEETVRAACRGAGLALEVRREGADRLRLSGSVDFDAALQVLAVLQRDYRLRVMTLAVVADGRAVRLDALLGRDT
jgi:hypothetical protein